jgi:uncharacterized protein (DUF1697 family)
MGVYIALFRGINVGPAHRVSMADLVTVFTDVGCRDVRTYIQSGNVVFAATEALARRAGSAVAARMATRCGFGVPIVIRSDNDMRDVIKRNPFLRAGAEANSLHVAFLETEPSAAQIERLDPRRSLPDEFAVRGREVYLRLPNGAGKTKLSNAYLESRLGTISTLRNWRTVTALAEMATLAAAQRG